MLRRNVGSKEAVKEQEVYISLCEFEVINQIYRWKSGFRGTSVLASATKWSRLNGRKWQKWWTLRVQGHRLWRNQKWTDFKREAKRLISAHSERATGEGIPANSPVKRSSSWARTSVRPLKIHSSLNCASTIPSRNTIASIVSCGAAITHGYSPHSAGYYWRILTPHLYRKLSLFTNIKVMYLFVYFHEDHCH